MFYDFLRGTIAYTTPQMTVLATEHIGYRIQIPVNIYSKLLAVSGEATLFISFIVRENIQALYGFLTRDERDLFESLLDVNGVGPKLALSLIGHLSLQEMQAAIALSDTQLLSKVPGVGKKTAERLIVEMRGRLPEMTDGTLPLEKKAPVSPIIQDAMSALVHLGYQQAIAEKAVRQVLAEGADKGLAELITSSLKYIREKGK
ncbi:MAG: ruvA [Chlamydiales bacterium]|jgi:Holliday junction DNA helicase RuvA|nr:ruvA [Chlamydiales bacterium]